MEMPIRKNRKEKQQQPAAKVESSQSDDGTEEDLTYSPEIQELFESYKEETTSLSKPVKKDIVTK
jgi:t-SNARE complex subunit (syntaxin)